MLSVSYSEPECLPSLLTITESDQGTDREGPTQSNTAAIIGGVVAIILIIAITIAVIVIVALVLRSRRGDVSFKNTLEK